MKNIIISSIGAIGIGGVQVSDSVINTVADASALPPTSWIEIAKIIFQAAIAIFSIFGVRKVASNKKK